MRFISLILLLFVMLMCTAPALEKDMCALRGSECQCEGHVVMIMDVIVVLHL